MAVEKGIVISLDSIASGDPAVIRLLYREYQPDFIAWTRKTFGLAPDEAREIFQESVVTLYENVINGKLVDVKSSIKTYLFAIGKNKTFEFLRRKGRIESLDNLSRSQEPVDEAVAGFESDSEMMRRQKIMKECVRELGQACQDILTLYYFQQLSLVQICEKLQYKNEETVKSQKFKCMQQLRRNFSSKYQGWL